MKLADRILATGAMTRIPSVGSKNRTYIVEDKNVFAIKDTNNDNIYIVDLEDKDKVDNRTWSLRNGTKSSYPKTNVTWCLENVSITLSRLIMSDDNNMYKEGNLVDHKNGNRYDNRKSNLRIVNSSQNAINRNRNSTNITEPREGYFQGLVTVNGEKYYKFSHDRKEVEDFVKETKKKYQGEYAAENRTNDGVYDEVCERIYSAKSVIHFDDEKLEKRYNFTNRNENSNQ